MSVAASTTSYLLVVCSGYNIAFRVCKWPIKVGADSTEGHSIKALRSLAMMDELNRRLCPDALVQTVATRAI